MHARRKHLITQVMEQYVRLNGDDEIKRRVFKKHLEQFSDAEIETEIMVLKGQ